jgi:DNA-binding CsgD family transcriptional regulator/N-acetylneuraminic acid mutarotase
MPPDVDLSDRELEILRLVATGASNKEIALKLVISPNTVKVHLRNVFSKIGVVSRTEAALYALRCGLVDHLVQPPVAEEAVEGESPAPAILDVPLAPPEEDLTPPEPAISRYRRFALVVLALLLVAALVVGVDLLGRAAAGPLVPAATSTAAAASSTAAAATSDATSLQQQRWQNETPLPEGRRGMAAIAYENSIYVFSGETSQGVTGSTLRIQLGQAAWETLSAKPTPVTDIQAAYIGEQVYIPGGRKADGQMTNVFEAYNLRLGQWSQLPPLPVALSGYALAALDGRLYLFGGWDGKQAVSTVYSFDPEAGAWQVRAPLSSRRAFAGAVALEGRIYLIGGSDGAHALSTVQVYFPQRDQAGTAAYEERAPLPEGRSAASATGIAGLIYVFGGQSDSQPAGGLAPLQYAPPEDHWTAFELSPVTVGAGPALVALDTRLHVLGGSAPGGMAAFHQSYQAIYSINLPAIRK